MQELTEVTTFIGTDIGDPYSPLAERAPRSARHVVTLFWSWSPAHSRLSEYRIATDRERRTWNLYEFLHDDYSGRRLCSRIATGVPYRGVCAKRAALRLLRVAWQVEVDNWEFDLTGVEVSTGGLLSGQDVVALAADLDWINSTTWLKCQSEESLSALRAQLPNPLDEQSIDTIEEIEACADELSLSHDFLSLCRHYDLAAPTLASLVQPIVREGSLLRERREREGAAHVQKFRREIDLIVSDLSTRPTRGGGMTNPPLRQKVKKFLERYIGARGALPEGEHKVQDFFGPVVDFDALRKKHGL